MAKFNKGDVVGIPCSVDDGPFEDERVVEFDSIEGRVSGFARQANLYQIKDGDWHLKGTVISSNEKTVTIMVEGSFFSTNGLANFAADAPFEKIAA